MSYFFNPHPIHHNNNNDDNDDERNGQQIVDEFGSNFFHQIGHDRIYHIPSEKKKIINDHYDILMDHNENEVWKINIYNEIEKNFENIMKKNGLGIIGKYLNDEYKINDIEKGFYKYMFEFKSWMVNKWNGEMMKGYGYGNDRDINKIIMDNINQYGSFGMVEFDEKYINKYVVERFKGLGIIDEKELRTWKYVLKREREKMKVENELYFNDHFNRREEFTNLCLEAIEAVEKKFFKAIRHRIMEIEYCVGILSEFDKKVLHLQNSGVNIKYKIKKTDLSVLLNNCSDVFYIIFEYLKMSSLKSISKSCWFFYLFFKTKKITVTLYFNDLVFLSSAGNKRIIGNFSKEFIVNRILQIKGVKFSGNTADNHLYNTMGSILKNNKKSIKSIQLSCPEMYNSSRFGKEIFNERVKFERYICECTGLEEFEIKGVDPSFNILEKLPFIKRLGCFLSHNISPLPLLLTELEIFQDNRMFRYNEIVVERFFDDLLKLKFLKNLIIPSFYNIQEAKLQSIAYYFHHQVESLSIVEERGDSYDLIHHTIKKLLVRDKKTTVKNFDFHLFNNNYMDFLSLFKGNLEFDRLSVKIYNNTEEDLHDKNIQVQGENLTLNRLTIEFTKLGKVLLSDLKYIFKIQQLKILSISTIINFHSSSFDIICCYLQYSSSIERISIYFRLESIFFNDVKRKYVAVCREVPILCSLVKLLKNHNTIKYVSLVVSEKKEIFPSSSNNVVKCGNSDVDISRFIDKKSLPSTLPKMLKELENEVKQDYIFNQLCRICDEKKIRIKIINDLYYRSIIFQEMLKTNTKSNDNDQCTQFKFDYKKRKIEKYYNF